MKKVTLLAFVVYIFTGCGEKDNSKLYLPDGYEYKEIIDNAVDPATLSENIKYIESLSPQNNVTNEESSEKEILTYSDKLNGIYMSIDEDNTYQEITVSSSESKEKVFEITRFYEGDPDPEVGYVVYEPYVEEFFLVIEGDEEQYAIWFEKKDGKEYLIIDDSDYSVFEKDKGRILENEPLVEYYKINDPDGYSNLRREPNGAIIQKVYENELFRIISSEGKWKEIQLDDGTTGFMHESRVIQN